MTIQKKWDVIEKPINDALDLSGWDLPKALELYRKGNPPLLEWLQSHIIYREIGSLAKQLRKMLKDYYSPKSAMFHYLHMAQGNNREYLQGETVRVKKYFYVLRPVLACLWIENGFGLVPMKFETMLDRVVTEPSLRYAIDKLLVEKKQGNELKSGKRISVISDFLNAQLKRLSGNNTQPSLTKDPNPLDELFVKILVETFGRNMEGSK